MKTHEQKAVGHTAGPWTIHNNIGKAGELGIVADGAPCIIAVMCNREEALECIARGLTDGQKARGETFQSIASAIIARAKGES